MSQSDSLKNIVGVALGVCFVCSIFVATAAVYLKPKQDANRRLEQRRNVLIAGDLMKEKADVEKVFSEKIKPVLVDLKTGEQLPEEKMTGELAPDKFDVKRLSKNPEFNQRIPADRDKAGLKRIPAYMMLYLVKDGNKIQQVIFPIWGNGLWSIMYGFIALDKDLKTVNGLTFYEHGETPGLGGEIDNPRWKASWKGKVAFDEAGALKLKVLKGVAAKGASSEIDGLSGATLTTRGVDDMIAFWFGDTGYYRPYLDKLRQEGIHE
jgi:Na+-transporting NADH:ubiquinone oxidoreductase subunit C